ncbi:hypothetical protein O1611_g1593 [Lasiodiplodia mahajangana]|uniref:Uncharacterized protein n=1 Tax=Lasiodiplodia mahajangana TaxID=1108764 RepID=A0ACC2JX53_9PEZI|nr:hypothetical protein O1611_g1593 [Lasiodiplodia mahajangana]
MTPRTNQPRDRCLSKLKTNARETYGLIKSAFSRQHDDRPDFAPSPNNEDKAEPQPSLNNHDQVGPTLHHDKDDKAGSAPIANKQDEIRHIPPRSSRAQVRLTLPSNNEDKAVSTPSRNNKDLYPYLSKFKMDVMAHYQEGVPEGYETFLPHDKLKDLVTADTVHLAFEAVRIKNDELARWVLENGRRLFLILVLSSGKSEERLSHLEDLKNDGIDDSVLPLGITIGLKNHVYSQKGEGRFPSLESWEDNKLLIFKNHQWPLSAPVFGVEFRHQLDPHQPLPYLSITQTPVSSGFLGEVSCADIHQAHIDAQRLEKLGVKPQSGSKGIPIAIKKAKDDEDFRKVFDQQTNVDPAAKEERNLNALQEIVTAHLIQPIAAYQRGSDRCFIFPSARGDNLSDYWREHESHRKDRDSLRWLIGQFVGLLSALELLHKEKCRHGDMKPENILWFKDVQNRGTLKIADTRLAVFHDRGMATTTPSGTFRYEPPEMDETRGQKSSRSRQHDIWSMGCIIVELLVWLMCGYNGVRSFRERTPYYFWSKKVDPSTRKTSYHVDDYVVACLDAMKKELKDNTAYMALLRLVQDRFLVVSVSEDYVSSPVDREIAERLHGEMQSVKRSGDHTRYIGCSSIFRIIKKKRVKPRALGDLGYTYKQGSRIY